MSKPGPLDPYQAAEEIRRQLLMEMLPDSAISVILDALRGGVGPDIIRSAVQEINEELSRQSLLKQSVEAVIKTWEDRHSGDHWVATEVPPR